MGKQSRDKGSRGERQVAKILTEWGWPSIRGCQHAGGPDSPDVRKDPDYHGPHPLDYVHIEVKYDEGISLGTLSHQKAFEQSKGDCHPDKTPLVWLKHKRKQPILTIVGSEPCNFHVIGMSDIYIFLNNLVHQESED